MEFPENKTEWDYEAAEYDEPPGESEEEEFAAWCAWLEAAHAGDERIEANDVPDDREPAF